MNLTSLNFSFRQSFRKLFLMVAVIFSLFSCKQEDSEFNKYSAYINAFTSGCISKSSTIKVSLVQDIPSVDLSSEIEGNPITFTPAIKGKAYWKNNNTIEFIPDKNELEPGKVYQAKFKLRKCADGIPSDLKDFVFSFKVNELGCNMTLNPITIISKDLMAVSGNISFTDDIGDIGSDFNKLASCFTAEALGNKKYDVEISAGETSNSYDLLIKEIYREADDSVLEIKTDFKDLGIKKSLTKSIDVPANSVFKVVSIDRVLGNKNGIVIAFSSIIKEQNLEGLIQIPEINSYVTEVENNKIYVYFDNSYNTKPFTLNIYRGIRDIDNVSLQEEKTLSFSSLLIKPQVEIMSEAAILPNAENLILPFRAVNLFAVDLSIIKIYENNVLSFLQGNNLSESDELRRWGRLVYKKRLVLDTQYSDKISKWSDYSIDLSSLFKQEPGAIYRVVLSFKKKYSAYEVALGNKVISFSNESELLENNGVSDKDNEEWDRQYEYYYYNGGMEYDYEKYNYEDRDDPLKPTYYMDSRKAAYCNVVSSNLGVIVKRNLNNNLWVAVTSILTTEPISGADITAYNYQLQPIGNVKTNNNGFAEIKTNNKPFVVVAEHNKQKTYVRVKDGEEQSVSRFNVGGTTTETGLKGFIYGERGVWRPGDTLNIAFMLEDKENLIPDNHPVTMELFNSRGQFFKRILTNKGINGLYTFTIPTDQDVPTGLWGLYVKVGGSTFHKSIRIETIKPNRLKIKLDLPDLVSRLEGSRPTRLSSEWLTGAKSSNLKAKVELSISKASTQFAGYEGYTFNNIASDFTSMEKEVFNGNLNYDGNADINFGLSNISEAPGMLNGKATAYVYEPGGNSNISIKTFKYSPYSSYVGLNVNAPSDRFFKINKEHKFDIVTLNENGKPVDRNNIQIKVYKVEWSWWWDSDNETFSSYVNNRSITPLYSASVNTVKGKAIYNFRPTGDGRYLIYIKDNESGHATGDVVYAGDPYYSDYSEKNSGVKMLSFSFDKKEYNVGDEATIIIPKSAKGRALVSFENGSSVIRQEWIDVNNESESKYSFKVTEDMAPNIYIHISLLQAHSQKTNDLPIRMYGVMPLSVVNNNSILTPVINVPEVIRPEQEFEVSVKEKEGKPMTYTLAIVDEGLLDITNFKTPNPWNYFYSKIALGVSTWDMYDNVVGAIPGNFASLFSVGGDEQLKPAEAKANRFKPIVKYIGPFSLKSKGSNSHKIKLPMYVGSVRTMVVAGENGAYGSAEKSSFVRMPLMILSTLPRVLSVNEEILLPVNVFAMEAGVNNVNVSVECSNKNVSVEGASKQVVSFSSTGDKLVYFKLKTGKSIGKTEIKINASSGSHQTYEKIEIDVRNPNPVVTLSKTETVKAGSSATILYTVEGSTNSDSFVRFEFLRMPDVKISRMYDYLMNYSHSCTEQLVSKALPLLFIDKFKELSEYEKNMVKTNTEEAIQSLYSRQHSNGGFVYWPGSSYINDWVTSYAGLYLVLAKEKGYAVNSGVLSSWEKYQKDAAKSWKKSSKNYTSMEFLEGVYSQAFRLYSLAVAGNPDLGAMNRLKEVNTQLPVQAKWMLAAAYAVEGKKRVAEDIIFNAATNVQNYYSGYVYGSSDRDEAVVLNTLVLMDRYEQALSIVKNIANRFASDYYCTTQSAAFSLMALSRFAEKTTGDFNISWSVNGKKQNDIKSNKVSFEYNVPSSPKSGEIVINNNGNDIYVNKVTRIQLLNDTLASANNNIVMSVRYVDMNNNPINILNLKQGTEFKSIISVRNIGMANYENMALTQIVPAGWEIITNNLNVSENDVNSNYTFRDIRDDRVCTYFYLNRGETKSFTVLLQAAYIGNFVLPALNCEEMYDPTVYARIIGGRAVVDK